MALATELLKQAIAHAENRRWLEVEGLARELQKLNPFLEHSYRLLKASLTAQNRSTELNELFQELDSYLPYFSDISLAIATQILNGNRYDDARRKFDQALSLPLTFDESRMKPFGAATSGRLRHDIEYLKHLGREGLLPLPLLLEGVAGLDALINSYEDQFLRGEAVQLSPVEIISIAGVYRRCLHLTAWKDSPEPTINEAVLRAALEQYKLAPPDRKYVTIDDVLAPAALRDLRRHLLNSSIWHGDAQKGQNYLGAYENFGLRNPLVSRIISEIDECLQSTGTEHRVEEVWCFKNVCGTENIGMHADFSKVNLNIWMTPDEFNLDPSSGGLEICQYRAPDHLSFDEYNSDSEHICKLLAGKERKKIDYKYNRGVLFDASLFHGSASIRFEPCYEGMRINMTFLIGSR